MKRTARLLLAFLLAAGGARADTTEPLGGRLETDAAGAVVLTLELPSERLDRLADKEGQAANFTRPALAELIRERFHYLLRLRVAEQEHAPNSVELVVPPDTTPWPDVVKLTATWTGIGPGLGRVVTQADSPNYRLALTLADRRGETSRPVAPARAAVAGPASAESWSGTLRRAGAFGFSRIPQGGIETICFVLGLCFGARRTRDLAGQVACFAFAHLLACALAGGGAFQVSESVARWAAAGVALSLAAVAAINLFERAVPLRFWSAPIVGFGVLHGIAAARALSDSPPPEFRAGPAFGAAMLGLGIGPLLGFCAAALCAGTWRRARARGPMFRTEFAVPASVLIGLGGLTLAWERLHRAWTL